MFSKLRFSQKENLNKCTCFEEQNKCNIYSGERFLAIIVFSCLPLEKLCLIFLFICFAWEIKGSFHSFLENELDFTAIMNLSPNILAKN